MPAQLIPCEVCKGTGRDPTEGSPTQARFNPSGVCRWCNGMGEHLNVPYPMFCIHPDKCAGLSSCPRSYACSE